MSLYRKYRPQKFKDLVNQEHIKKTLLAALSRGRIGHAYLFAGPRGTGKTTAARLLAKALNCPHRNPEPCNRCFSCKEQIKLSSLDLIEIDAASNRGIDEIRELRERIKLVPSSSEYKVFIIDEVHMLTPEAFNALLKTLEEPPSHAIFILATTEPHKIPATVLSRCQRFDFTPLGILEIVQRLKKISQAEKIKFDKDGLRMIAAAASGGMRDAISILDQLSSSGKKINAKMVQETLGVVSERAMLKLFESLINKDLDLALEALAKIKEKGYNLIHFREMLLNFLREVLIYKISSASKELKDNYSREICQKMMSLSSQIEIKELIRMIKVIARDSLIEKDTIPSLGLEIALVELAGEKQRKTKKNKEQLKNFPELWRDFLQKIRPYNHSLAAIISSARIIGVDQNQIIIEVDYDFHCQKIENKKNLIKVEEKIAEVFGRKYQLICRVGKDKKAKNLKDIALEVFN
ncbi:MAG: DNA polymerase III subunit gamma/tau [Candidatus Berkelbacteria bacterium Licking1014_96]|uniref:DNA polymerase III subunit gamma/tau n=1 Tax=Candidatus Berkelbacteria bacterium Licking1014_96 TaxID=2017149 RepID=A0A554LHI5_9BACT|nr:MAG: DNA polymerase III subunit gamma/tau [Candidatus Berkelbacteria bacterium Licking1014_96]